MNPEPKPAPTLDQVFEQAEGWARFSLAQCREMRPTLFCATNEPSPGIHIFNLDTTMDTPEEKNRVRDTCRLLNIAHAASASVLAVECWFVKREIKDGKRPVLDEMPSESIDRQESVVLMGEDFTGRRQRFFNVVRHGNGKYFNLSRAEGMVDFTVGGRFSHLLLPAIMPPEVQAAARMSLMHLGHKLVEVKPTP